MTTSCWLRSFERAVPAVNGADLVKVTFCSVAARSGGGFEWVKVGLFAEHGIHRVFVCYGDVCKLQARACFPPCPLSSSVKRTSYLSKLILWLWTRCVGTVENFRFVRRAPSGFVHAATPRALFVPDGENNKSNPVYPFSPHDVSCRREAPPLLKIAVLLHPDLLGSSTFHPSVHTLSGC